MNCAPSALSVQLDPNASQIASVLFDAGVPGTTGTVRLKAALAADTTVASDVGYRDMLSSSAVTNTVSVQPDSVPVSFPVSSTTPFSFQVRQTSASSFTYNFTLSCTGGVSCGAAPVPLALSDTATHVVTVNVTANATIGAAGFVTLTAIATSGGATDAGVLRTTNTGAVTISVKPDTSITVATVPTQNQDFSLLYSGAGTGTFNLAVSCATVLQSCQLAAGSTSPITLSPNVPQVVRVQYNASTAGSAAALTLTATRVGVPTDIDAGTVQVTRTATPVIPWTLVEPSAVRVPGKTKNLSVLAGVFNLTPGTGADSFTVSLSCATPALNCAMPANYTSLWLTRGYGYTFPVTYDSDVGGLVGGVIKVTATAVATGNKDADSTIIGTVWMVASTAPNNATAVDAGRCAASCFAAAHAMATVPYYSLGVARSVALAYQGDAVAVRPTIHLDVAQVAGAPATQQYRLEVLNGASVLTQTNGDTQVRYAPPPSVVSDTVRLSAQVDVSALLGTSAAARLSLSARVMAVYASYTDTLVVPVSVMVVNDRKSAAARGWSIAGLQRLYTQGFDAIVVDGAGSAAYFTNSGTGSYVAPAGEFSRLSSAGSGVNLVYSRAFPDSSRLEFDYQGRLLRAIGRTLETTTFRHDGTGRLIEIDDPIRKTAGGGGTPLKTVLTYGTYGLTSITEPGPFSQQAGGRSTSIVVANDSTLTTWTDPDGVATRFGYDAQRRLQMVVNRRGDSTVFAYDAVTWKLASTRSPLFTTVLGDTARLTNNFGPWQTVAVARGSTLVTPLLAVRADTVRGAITTPGGLITAFTVDAWGQPVVTTVQPGLTGQQVTRVFRTAGSPLADSVQSPIGGIDRFRYAADGLLAWQQLAGQDSVRIQYGLFGQPTSVTGPKLASQTFHYTTARRGQPDSVTVAGTSTTRFVYDSLFRLILRKDALSNADTLSYDIFFGQLERTAGPGRRIAQTYFDGVGRDSVLVANPVAPRRTYYDVLNRVRLTRTDALGGLSADSIRYVYGVATLDSVVDPIGQGYRYSYNTLGAVTSATDPTGVAQQTLWDAAGRAARTINRRGDVMEFTYDTLGRVIIRRALRGGTTLVRADSFFFAPSGRIAVGSNATSRDSVFTDATGWTDSVVTRYQTDMSKRVLRRYVKGAYNQLDSVGVAYPGAIAATTRRYYWSPTSNVLDSVRVAGQLSTLTYNATFLASTRSQPGGVSQTFQRTTSDQAYSWNYAPSGVDSLLGRGAAYDSLGRVRDTFRPGATGYGQRFTRYGYDARGRLVTARDSALGYVTKCNNPVNGDYGEGPCGTATRSQQWRDSLSFDAVGNITNSVGRAGTGAASYTSNRLTSWPGGFTYEFDADGNTTRRRKTTAPVVDSRFFWSPDGLLDSVVTANGRRLTYEYNAFGQLARRRTNGIIDRHFAWDQGGRGARRNPMAAGAPTTTTRSSPATRRVSTSSGSRTKRWRNHGIFRPPM
ncbi:MAG: hypothetical protein Q8K82_15800 [Gemmatimonadaceae bacterium]|nr:hypothetical protein [Gemmatimonadaceae bacterium]